MAQPEVLPGLPRGLRGAAVSRPRTSASRSGPRRGVVAGPLGLTVRSGRNLLRCSAKAKPNIAGPLQMGEARRPNGAPGLVLDYLVLRTTTCEPQPQPGHAEPDGRRR